MLNIHLNQFMRRLTMKLLGGVRDKGLQSLFSHDFTIYLVDDTPRTISDALVSPDADGWKEVVYSEMDSILSSGN
jgi:hypothetical protein